MEKNFEIFFAIILFMVKSVLLLSKTQHQVGAVKIKFPKNGVLVFFKIQTPKNILKP